MPTATIFTLRPTVNATISANLSRSTHAAILRLIATHDQALAEQLHTDARVKPLTVSNLLGLTGNGSSVTVSSTRRYDLRVTLLSPDLEAVAAHWTPATVASVELDGTTWHVERIANTTAAHNWAGQVAYEALAAPALKHPEHGPTRWTLDFAAPVTFRQRGLNQPFPTPELVFGSLLDKWNSFAPLTLPHEVRTFAAERLAVNNFDLRSVAAPTKGGALQIGTVGRCTYTATQHDPFWLACIDILARFAFYSGIGAGAARGFGRTQLIRSDRRAHAGKPRNASARAV
jgi:CRISPR-associated endoribonuclease Cas6